VSGYGSSGPYAARKAYDLLIQSETGLLAITGTEDTPCKVGVSIADIAAGMYAYSGILTALFSRARTGHGTVVEVSLFDSLAEWMSAPAYYTGYGGTPPRRSGPDHASIAPYGPFRSRDERRIYVAIQNAREWRRFCEVVLRQPGLASDPRFSTNPLRVEHRAALHATIDTVLGSLDDVEIVGRLEDGDIAWARMNTVQEFLDHPQLQASGRWRAIGSPAGTLRVLAPPARLDGIDPVVGDVPALGQHTESILAELGMDGNSIQALREERAIS
jgi:itaconate CoA-transferase